ncbi:ATP-binding cassette domain-containing protein [Bifidobacterium aquikefiri]|uniref:ATP-binding cassette domain-containing protein n=1 Tax=Bifidobacterium aquikefiri TaxID=1653207 RepID=UPI0039EA6134
MKQLSVLSLNHISFAYPNSPEAVFSDISVTFPLGWTAVVGDNGIGKTTLMRIAIGQTTASEGTVIPDPKRAICGYCPQRSDSAPENLDDFANDWSTETMGIRRTLDIEDDWPWRFDTLSGGERKRLQLACALAVRPDILVFDEPSNHVDSRTRSAIAKAMQGYDGIGILVSHDVDLIDATVSQCVFLQRQHVGGLNRTIAVTRNGNYTQAESQLRNESARSQRDLMQARGEFQRLTREQTQRNQHLQHIEKMKDGRHIDRKDHDALNTHKLAKSTGMDLKASRLTANMASRVRQAELAASNIITASKRYDGDIWFDCEPSHRRELVRVEAGVIPFDPSVGRATVGDSVPEAKVPEASVAGVIVPTLSIGPQDHIGISGDNGTGKTTLFRYIESLLDSSHDVDTRLLAPQLGVQEQEQSQERKLRVLIIEQEMNEAQIAATFGTVDELGKEEYSQLCGSLAQLNADPEHILAERSPSAGEVRKLQLCLGALRHPHVIMMDEPTNHLDLHSVESRARVLKAFTGSLAVISHNEHFLSQITNIRWQTERDSRDHTRLRIE